MYEQVTISKRCVEHTTVKYKYTNNVALGLISDATLTTSVGKPLLEIMSDSRLNHLPPPPPLCSLVSLSLIDWTLRLFSVRPFVFYFYSLQNRRPDSWALSFSMSAIIQRLKYRFFLVNDSRWPGSLTLFLFYFFRVHGLIGQLLKGPPRKAHVLLF